MIVLLNADDAADAAAVGEVLAARYDHAAALRHADDATSERQAVSRQQRGASDLVISGHFATAAALARLRRRLSALDDVTYAFWLRRAGDPPALEAEADRGDVGYPIAADGRAPAALAGAIWDNIHEQVALAEPDPGWAAAFVAERAAIAAALGPLATGIHHIGSTAVPGLPAKPVIDVMVSVGRLEPDATACIAPLRALGYCFVDYPQNTDRRFFRKGSPRTHHLHVVADGSPSLVDHLGFRDALRADDALRAEYAALKRQLAAALGSDRAAYGAAKTALIARALGHPPR